MTDKTTWALTYHSILVCAHARMFVGGISTLYHLLDAFTAILQPGNPKGGGEREFSIQFTMFVCMLIKPPCIFVLFFISWFVMWRSSLWLDTNVSLHQPKDLQASRWKKKKPATQKCDFAFPFPVWRSYPRENSKQETHGNTSGVKVSLSSLILQKSYCNTNCCKTFMLATIERC